MFVFSACANAWCLLFVFQDRMMSMTLDKDNEVAVQTMKLLLLISKWVCCSHHFPQCFSTIFLCIKLLLTPQNIWWCAQSKGLQAAAPVCLLFTAPFSSHCRGAALLTVRSPPSLKKNKETIKQTKKRSLTFAWTLLVSVRLLNTVAPASDTQDEINEEEAHKQQTSARLKALLQFYQESEVKTHGLFPIKALVLA